MAKDIFKIDFCNIVKFDCSCGRRYVNTSNCRQCTFSDEKQTNADRIRSMTDEELAEFLHAFDSCKYCNRTEDECCTSNDCDTHSVKVMLDWLQKDSEV